MLPLVSTAAGVGSSEGEQWAPTQYRALSVLVASPDRERRTTISRPCGHPHTSCSAQQGPGWGCTLGWRRGRMAALVSWP